MEGEGSKEWLQIQNLTVFPCNYYKMSMIAIDESNLLICGG